MRSRERQKSRLAMSRLPEASTLVRAPRKCLRHAEKFFVIGAVGSAIYAEAFLETLASEHAKTVNNPIASALKERRDGQEPS